MSCYENPIADLVAHQAIYWLESVKQYSKMLAEHNLQWSIAKLEALRIEKAEGTEKLRSYLENNGVDVHVINSLIMDEMEKEENGEEKIDNASGTKQ